MTTLEPTAAPPPAKLDSFTRAYITTALWSSTGYQHGECPCCGRPAVLDKLPESEFEQELMCDAPGCGVREAEPQPFDKFADESDIAPETLAQMVKDCAEFQAKHGDTIRAAIATGEVRCGPDFDAWGHAGHDFWLTRCRHGAGFWDGDWPEPMAEALTEAAHAFGEVDLYMGDDGKIYA